MTEKLGAEPVDPSRPTSVKVQKWAVFSIFLAIVGIGSDAIAALMNSTPLSFEGILGKGELYMVSIGMLLSACGELLYDRTRVEPTPAWEISISFIGVIFGIAVAIMYGFVKSGRSSAFFVTYSSLSIAGFSIMWGLMLVIVSCRGDGTND